MNALPSPTTAMDQGHQLRAEKEARNSAIEVRIIRLAGEINAAEYRFLTLLREFDDVNGWAGDGIKSFAHWLNYKIGMSDVAAREKVRVARALVDLPQINEAFRVGEISYSKVRAMTRVATPDNEALLVTVAKYGTASHMERLTRQYRRVKRINEVSEADIWREERGFRYKTDVDGMVEFHGRFPAEEGAVIVKALEVMCESLRRERGNAAREAAARAKNQPCHGDAVIEQNLAARRRLDPRTVDYSGDAAKGDQVPVQRDVPAETFGRRDDASTAEDHRHHRDTVRARNESEHQMVGQGNVPAETIRRQNDASTANDQHPHGRVQTRNGSENQNAGQGNVPAESFRGQDDASTTEDHQHRRGRVQTRNESEHQIASQGNVPAESFGRQNDASTAEDHQHRRGRVQTRNESEHQNAVPQNVPAESFSNEELPDILSDQATALVQIAERILEQANEARTGGSFSEKFQVMLHINTNEADPDHRISGETPCHLGDGHFLSREVARQLCCDAHRRVALVNQAGDVLDIGRRSRTIPRAMRHALAIRDGGCRFPGCGQTRWTDGHHIVHWADGGETSLANLVTLCRRHHTLIHQGEFSIEKTETEFIFINDRGQQIPRAIHPQFEPIGADQRVTTLLADQRELNIDHTTAETRWRGETLDYDMAIQILATDDEKGKTGSN
ncbi:MAG: DUF222 domain-containing protein [Proteobacteria bacterium]|jgi:hypothetical protein|nr:DUF222 domain-containing protein [Pseudomonadota bacterium]